MAPTQDPPHVEHKKKVNLADVSGAEHKDQDDTSTAILKKKKKPNQLMYVFQPSVVSTWFETWHANIFAQGHRCRQR